MCEYIQEQRYYSCIQYEKLKNTNHYLAIIFNLHFMTDLWLLNDRMNGLDYLASKIFSDDPFVAEHALSLSLSEKLIWENPSALQNILPLKTYLRGSIQVIHPCDSLSWLPHKTKELPVLLKILEHTCNKIELQKFSEICKAVGMKQNTE
jgi:hypothetical protein